MVEQKLIYRSNDTPIEPPEDLLLTHKTLMALLLQYEHLTKRISSIQCEEGGNQATVQGAVARMAATFLTKEMLKVQVSRSSHLSFSHNLPISPSPSPSPLPCHFFSPLSLHLPLSLSLLVPRNTDNRLYLDTKNAWLKVNDHKWQLSKRHWQNN